MDLDSLPLRDLLEQVAAKTPVPGGGAVTGAVGALAAALGSMVVSYSIGRKSLAQHEEALRSAAAALANARTILIGLAHEDALAYERLNELLKISADDERRTTLLPQAALTASHIPLSIIATCSDLLRLFDSLVPITNRQLRSDLAIGAILVEATARAARWNIDINLPLLADPAAADSLTREAAALLTRAAELVRRIEQGCG